MIDLEQSVIGDTTEKENEESSSILPILSLAHVEIPAVISPSFYTQITKLDLFQCGLSSLPIEISTVLPNLSILFCMKNLFTQVPAVIGLCPNLQMVSFKSNLLSSIHPDALQKQMRWLILTENQLTHIPDTMGRCIHLQKLMLSGNKITQLPDTIVQCQQLQLIRLASNQLTQSPMYLLCHLPQLAWMALSDNPFLGLEEEDPCIHDAPLDESQFQDTGEILGSGASGITRKFIWKKINSTQEEEEILPVAVKTFSSTLTSDGNPMQEKRIALMTCYYNIHSPVHALVQVHGILPSNGALVMELLHDYIVFAQPPNMQSCTRDVYDPHTILLSTVEEAQEMIYQLLIVMIHLHSLGISHGDFYGHNILISSPTTTKSSNSSMDKMPNRQQLCVKLTDFGASFLYSKKSDYGPMIECIEVRAFGHLLSEIRDLLLFNHGNDTMDNTAATRFIEDREEKNKFCHGLQDLIQYCHGDSLTSFTELMHLWKSKMLVDLQ